MMSYFGKEFGFTSTEVVALMGVHTLGQASSTNSGFQAPTIQSVFVVNVDIVSV